MMRIRKRIIRRWIVTGYGIIAAILLAVLGIGRKITDTVLSTSGVAYEQKVDSVAFGYKLEQPFDPQYQHLDAIRIYVDASSCSRKEGSLRAVIRDAAGEDIFISDLALGDLPQYGWIEIGTDLELSPGRMYTIVLEGVGTPDRGPKISILDAELAATEEQRGYTLAYAGMEVANTALRIAFAYAVPVGMRQYLTYLVFGLAVVLCLSAPRTDP